MNMPKFGAVIFDLDGVITDTARYHFLAWKHLAESLGIAFDEAFNERLKGVDRMGSLDLILERSTAVFSHEEKRALAEQKNLQYQQLITTMSADDLLPGALAALDSVHAAGLKTGLASVSKNAATVLNHLGIADRFDYIVDAAAITHSKPDPEIFLTAAEHLTVAPARCIGVEDAMVGVQAIKAAGMFAVGVGDPDMLGQADVVIPGLELFDLTAYWRGTPQDHFRVRL